MGIKSIGDIENDVENELLERFNERFSENDEEYVLVFIGRDMVSFDMACGLMEENDITFMKKADETLGIFGVAIHSRLYVLKSDLERAVGILTEFGFFDDEGKTPGENEPDGEKKEDDDK